MRAGFTPGPWVVEGRAWSVTAADGQMNVCDIRGWGYLTGKGSLALSDAEGVAIQTANANLIASAPDMVAALDHYADQLCEGWCEQSPDCAHFDDCGGCLARRVAWQARRAETGTVSVHESAVPEGMRP